MKRILCLVLALLALAGFALAEPGEMLPGLNRFTADTLDGGVFTEANLADVDLTVVNIWSVTCPPCVQEMPELAALAKALPKNVRLIAVCMDAYLAEEELKQFLDEIGFEAVTLVQGDGDLTALLARVRYTPTTLFLDSEGNPALLPMIGSPEDVEATYLQQINAALAALGKDEITLVKTMA